jgi:alpha-L-rhamnosidase
VNITPHILLAALLVAAPASPAASQPDGLLCEYREDPVGIDSPQPRLSWRLKATGRGARQTAYHILVASARANLDRDDGDLWDSGRVESDQSLHVPYAGRLLEARQQVFWKVRIWDGAGAESAWSPVAGWEMGLPDAADWGDARWIQLAQDTRTSPLRQRLLNIESRQHKPMVEVFPAPMFRREFEVKPGMVRARAYLCGLGLAELSINGRRVGDAVLEPSQTTYDVRACYVIHDLAPFMRPGRNAAGIQSGNGFFGQNVAFGAPWLALGRPVVIARLVVDYEDGSSTVVGTDESWKAETGPIVYDNIYAGETYDARLERSGWDRPGYDDSSWQVAVAVPSPAARLVAQMIDPIRRKETLKPRRVIPGLDGKWIFDFGRNIAGWPKLSIEAPAGTQLTLKCAEILTPDGRQLDHDTTGWKPTGVEQTAIYFCKGEGTETWEQRFAYHGFRYIEVEGLPGQPAPGFLEAVVVFNDVARRGSFTSSDEMLNRIYQTSLHTLEGNLHSTLTDCPHREKCGWLGDAHATGETAIFNYDMAQFWTKFVDDIETVLGRGGQTYWQQKATPGIPCNIALGRRLCQEARPDWGSAYVLLPWYLHTYYGDTAVFARHYEHLRRWIDYVKDLREDGIVTKGYGDWCPPGGNDNIECPPPLTSTAIFYATLDIMADFARQLEKTEDAQYFSSLAVETRAAFNREFFDATTGGYGSQTANAVALRFGLPPEGKTAAVAESLAREVAERHKGHVLVGIHGGRPIFSQLAEHGHINLALAALKKDTWPGHAYTLNQGFTTWPEVAEEVIPGGPNPDRSLNHPMHSGFAAFFHESLGGIRPAAPGFKHIHLKPHGFHQLESVEVFHDSLYGRIESRWQSQGGRLHWAVRVPPNTTATAWLPARTATAATEGGQSLSEVGGVRMIRQDGDRLVLQLESGSYHFISELPPT